MNEITVVIDGKKANKKHNSMYRGFGMISANNSSRLLLDYKAENPDSYWEILRSIFGKDGLGMCHLKLEMGSDINSSSGTEPSVMRYEDESADVTRGVGYQLAKDAKEINPDVTLDMLWWSEPAWVSNSEDIFDARYKWYKETLDAAYRTYGLKFDYVSANQNERAVDPEWIKYLSRKLKSEQNSTYDYSKIKIVAADEEGRWAIGDHMLEDKELCDAVDVIGSHYTDWSTPAVQKLAGEYGKEIWFSEGCPPMSHSEGTYRYDETGSGLEGINGVLDIANRIITMYPGGNMTLYEFQPVVSAYYDGVTYCSKQLITANEPWSGYYKRNSGFYMSLHFARFIKFGWTFIDGACSGDGKPGGDGHAVVDATYSYMTASNPETDDYSMVITNTTHSEMLCHIEVSNLAKSSSNAFVWETKGPEEGGSFDDNYFKKINNVTPEKNGDKYIYSIFVKPFSMVTVSTLDLSDWNDTYGGNMKRTILPLPYTDDYEYREYAPNYLASRGQAPRYTTDEGGAFEVIKRGERNVLMQKITEDLRAKEWGYTPDPVTNFGDDCWFNYKASVDIFFDHSNNPEDNYAGVGVRYNLGDAGISGYSLRLYEDGRWQLMRNKENLTEGRVVNLDISVWNNIAIEAVEDKLTAYLNNEELICHIADIDNREPIHGAGRAALYSAYYCNCFDNFKAETVGDVAPYIIRIDDTHEQITYSGDWTHTLMSSFKNYHRTVSQGEVGACVEIAFSGTGFALIGANEKECVIQVEIDGTVIHKEFVTPKSDYREATYYHFGLENDRHTAKIKVLSGSFDLDAVEITSNLTLKEGISDL